jgi:hypothetical protein
MHPLASTDLWHEEERRMWIRLLSMQDDQLEMVLEMETRTMWYLALQHYFSNYGNSSSQCALWGFGRFWPDDMMRSYA